MSEGAEEAPGADVESLLTGKAKKEIQDAAIKKGNEMVDEASGGAAEKIASFRLGRVGSFANKKWAKMEAKHKEEIFDTSAGVLSNLKQMIDITKPFGLKKKGDLITDKIKWIPLVATGAVGTKEECAMYTKKLVDMGWTVELIVKLVDLAIAAGDKDLWLVGLSGAVKGEKFAVGKLLELQEKVFSKVDSLEREKAANEAIRAEGPVEDVEEETRAGTSADVKVPPENDISDIPKDGKGKN